MRKQNIKSCRWCFSDVFNLPIIMVKVWEILFHETFFCGCFMKPETGLLMLYVLFDHILSIDSYIIVFVKAKIQQIVNTWHESIKYRSKQASSIRTCTVAQANMILTLIFFYADETSSRWTHTMIQPLTGIHQRRRRPAGATVRRRLLLRRERWGLGRRPKYGLWVWLRRAVVVFVCIYIT
jgi:hypothetical protein